MSSHHKYSLMIEWRYMLCCVMIENKNFHKSRLKTLRIFFPYNVIKPVFSLVQKCTTWYSPSDIPPVIFPQWYSPSDIPPVIFLQWYSPSDIPPVIFPQWYSPSDIPPVIFPQWYSPIFKHCFQCDESLPLKVDFSWRAFCRCFIRRDKFKLDKFELARVRVILDFRNVVRNL